MNNLFLRRHNVVRVKEPAKNGSTHHNKHMLQHWMGPIHMCLGQAQQSIESRDLNPRNALLLSL